MTVCPMLFTGRRLMEEGYRRAMLGVRYSIPGFFFDLIRNPISLVLTLGIIFSVLSGTQFWARMKGKVWKSKKVAI